MSFLRFGQEPGTRRASRSDPWPAEDASDQPGEARRSTARRCGRGLRVGLGLTAVGCAAAVAVPAGVSAQPRGTQVFEGSARDAAGLQATVARYRAALGNPDNASNPPAASGRREINWDGVPDARAAPNLLPPDFFNTTARRGAVFSSAGNRFQVSANQNNPTGTAVRFGNLNRQYSQVFATVLTHSEVTRL